MDKREILQFEPVLTPRVLREQHPLTEAAGEMVLEHRETVRRILSGEDERLLVIVGPCSLDDETLVDGRPAIAAFAQVIAELTAYEFVASKIQLILRAPPSKPRKNIGWAGLDQTDLSRAHALLTELTNQHMPLSIEVKHEKHFARYGDMLSLGWVGARDVGSTQLRHTVSAYPEIPMLFKNGEDGTPQLALDAIATARTSHQVELVDPDNRFISIMSTGHADTGLIARGGAVVQTPQDFERSLALFQTHNIPMVVDCAHGNAIAHDANNQKSVTGQGDCLEHLLKLRSAGRLPGLRGIMLEGYILEGSGAEPGQSKTDPCMGMEQTLEAIYSIAKLA